MEDSGQVSGIQLAHRSGPRSMAARYAPRIRRWISETLNLSSCEILPRVWDRLPRRHERAPRAGEPTNGGAVRMKLGPLHWRALWGTNLRGRRVGLGLRLSSKIFLASALVIVVFAGVSALSLGAVGRLVSVNREITTSTIPTLSLTASAREAIPRLVALEARALVLGDRRYATAWSELATQIAEDLERLAVYPLSEPEALHRSEASAAFA